MIYLYFDENDYIIGYGSDYEEGSYRVDTVPLEVDQHLGAYKLNRDTGEFIPDENKKAYLLKLESTERKLMELENWFSWYDQQCMQYSRAQRLGISFNRDINELDAQARENASKILSYRSILETPYTPPETSNEI